MAASTFGLTVREWREEAGMTLKVVADALGFSVPYISDIERGRRNPPELDKIIAFARLCGREDDVDLLLKQAAEFRGEVAIQPSRDNARGMLVTLQRNIDSLDDEQIDRILRILRGDQPQ